MRYMTWMLISICLFGCGSQTKMTSTAAASKTEELAIPPEVAGYFARGELALAIEKLSDMIARSSRDSQLYALRATACHRLGKYTEALSDFDQAIALNPNDARLYNNRGFILLGIEKYEEARSDFNRSTELDPQYMNPYNNRGLLYIAQKKYADAVTQFNLAIKIDPKYVDAYNNRGFAEFEMGRIEQALDDFNLAINLNSNYVNAFNNRGLLRARAGDYENAVVDFTHAMMIDPLNPKYYEHRRDVYLRLGSVDKARADERKMEWLFEYHRLTANLSRSAQPVRELIERARHYMRINDDENALRDLDQAIELDAQSAEALAVRARLYLQQRLYAEAKNDAVASLAVEPNQQAYSVLGDVFLKQKDYDQAIENYVLAHRVDQDVAKAYYSKAKQLEEQGKAEMAKDNLQQALVLDPEVETRIR